eukprot:SAG31_NODE_4475_length_3202_cov_23.547713_2_plen_72_part_00
MQGCTEQVSGSERVGTRFLARGTMMMPRGILIRNSEIYGHLLSSVKCLGGIAVEYKLLYIYGSKCETLWVS